MLSSQKNTKQKTKQLHVAVSLLQARLSLTELRPALLTLVIIMPLYDPASRTLRWTRSSSGRVLSRLLLHLRDYSGTLWQLHIEFVDALLLIRS